MKIVGGTPFPFGEEKDVCIEVRMSVALDLDSTNLTPENLAAVVSENVWEKLNQFRWEGMPLDEYAIDEIEVLGVTDLHPEPVEEG